VCITVEDFSEAKLGECPADWKVRQDKGKAVYTGCEEGGKRFLRAVAKKIGIQVAKPYPAWDIKATHLAWRDTTQTHVLETGTARRGEWVEERVNVLADYQRFFGASKAPNPVGIAVLTDSDDTKTSAQGDYAGFRVCRG
jgi:hypothetical protein